MKDLQNLTDREILLLTAQELKRVKTDLREHRSKTEQEMEKINNIVVKHEKFKNTLIGAMSVSLAASISAFWKTLTGH